MLDHFRNAAINVGVDLDRAIALTIERQLVLNDARSMGLAVDAARCLLNRAARAARVTYPVSSGAASYLRGLGKRGRSIAQPPGDLTAAIPAHLFDRVRITGDRDLLDPDALCEAVRWERAAVLARRTLNEWALFSLESRPRP